MWPICLGKQSGHIREGLLYYHSMLMQYSLITLQTNYICTQSSITAKMINNTGRYNYSSPLFTLTFIWSINNTVVMLNLYHISSQWCTYMNTPGHSVGVGIEPRTCRHLTQGQTVPDLCLSLSPTGNC